MKERPILFTGEMVRATLDGRMTQMRRPVKPQPVPFGEDSPFTQAALKEHVGKPWMPVGGVFQENWNRPLGTVGDRLWVRETWRCRGGREYEYQKHQPSIMYHADAEPVEAICNEWRPSIHMPRWASRIDLEITAVRVERVQDITEEDARKEGVRMIEGLMDETLWEDYVNADNMLPSATQSFASLWQSIYGTWDANPWVWVYEFRRVKP